MSLTRISKEHEYISPRKFSAMDGKGLADFPVEEFKDLYRLGINLNDHSIRKMMNGIRSCMDSVGMDALQPLITQASIGTPIQFLQNWLPGFVFVVTAARKIDDLVGLFITGSWEDEQIVQGILERTGTTLVYDDYANIPLSSWNTNFVYRTVVRFEEGLKVGALEAARSARMEVDDSGMKRESAALALEIQRNLVGFYGFNNGANNTYGFLNDPGLPAYTEVAATGAGGSTLWSQKTYLEITADIRLAIQTLRSQSQDLIDPETVELTLAIATNAVDYLSVTSDFGYSVRQWLKETYPKIRVVSAPQLNAANASLNVFYLYAEKINDMSTDGGKVFIQPVPAKFFVLGVQQLAKAYEEDYSMATAGVLCKRPWAVTRWYGV